MSRACFIALAAVLAMPSASASAETLGLVTMVPDESPISEPELSRALKLAATGAGHQVVLDPVSVARRRVALGAVLADRLKPFARADDLLQEGWRSYALVQMAVAKARLVAARQAALEVADLAGGIALVAETSLRLGVIEFELGEPAAAADFRLAHRLAPDRAVTDDEFKPAVVTAFRAAIAAPTVKRPVAIAVSPANGAVSIDGTLRAGAKTLDLEVGLHLLVVSAPGMIAAGNLAVVPSAGPAEIGATLAVEPATVGLFAGDIELRAPAERTGSILESTAMFAELDGLVLASAGWRGKEMVIYAQKCTAPPLGCSPITAVTVPTKAALAVSASEIVDRIDRGGTAEKAARLPTHEPILASKKPKKEIPVVVVPDPWWKNRWLWIGVGAAAVAAGTTAVILSIDGDSPLVIDTDPCQFGGC